MYMLSKNAIVTLSDKDFIQGTRVLMESLQFHNDLKGFDKIALTPNRQEITEVSHLFDQIKVLEESELSRMNRPNWKKRFRKTFLKLHAFDLREYKRVIFIDSDVLCIGDIGRLFQDDLDDYCLSAASDRGIKPAPKFASTNRVRFNTGVMVINNEKLPSNSLQKMQELARKGITYDGSDQGVINEFCKGDISFKLLDQKYNTLKRSFKEKKYWSENKDDIRLLHFVGKKPWSKLSMIKNPDILSREKGYDKIEDIWHNYRSGKAYVEENSDRWDSSI
jgi:lipopolysaccharide biosynthesis glycosyltransferase